MNRRFPDKPHQKLRPSEWPGATQRMLAFFRQIIRAPATIGAVAPSSDALSLKMAKAVPQGPGFVVELGPGTGSITEGLFICGVKPEELIVVEYSRDFAETLGKRFGLLNLVIGDATDLSTLLRQQNYSSPLGARAIVSSLPLRAMTPDKHKKILQNAFAELKPGGVFIQFTYGPLRPVSAELLQSLGLRARNLGMVWQNIPPASVWLIESV